MTGGASESLLLLTLIGIPSIFTLVVIIIKRWPCLWKAGLVWSIGLALLVWSLDPVLPTLDEPWAILSDPYLWILVLFVVSMANIGAFRGRIGVYLFGIGALTGGALLFWIMFPATAGWIERIPIADQWRPLVELTGWTWIATLTVAVLTVAYLGRGGQSVAGALIMYAASLTYVAWLTWQQVTTMTIVAHSVGVLYVLVGVFGAFVLVSVPLFWPSIPWSYATGTGIMLGLQYVVFAIVLPELLVYSTGYPLIVSGWWPF